MSSVSEQGILRADLILGEEEWDKAELELAEIGEGLKRLDDPENCAEQTRKAVRTVLEEVAGLLGIEVNEQGSLDVSLQLKYLNTPLAAFQVAVSIDPDKEYRPSRITTRSVAYVLATKDARASLRGISAVILAVPFVRKQLVAFLQDVRCAFDDWRQQSTED